MLRRDVVPDQYPDRRSRDGLGPRVLFHLMQHQQKENICRMQFFNPLKYPLLIFLTDERKIHRREEGDFVAQLVSGENVPPKQTEPGLVWAMNIGII